MNVQLGDTILVSVEEIERSKADSLRVQWEDSELMGYIVLYLKASFTVVKAAGAFARPISHKDVLDENLVATRSDSSGKQGTWLDFHRGRQAEGIQQKTG
jgi:hypothetical protein